MKLIKLTILILVIAGCNNNNPSQTIDSETKPKTKIISVRKISPSDDTVINLDIELSQKHSNHLVSYKNGVLSFCCQEELAYPFGSNQPSQVKNLSEDFNDSTLMVEINGELTERTLLYTDLSRLTFFNYTHDDGWVEYYITDDSYFADKNINLKYGIKIGMSKTELLSRYIYSSRQLLLSEIKVMAVCPDERGELFTRYHFKNDTLVKISYSY